MELNFGPPPPKCKHCGKRRGDHKADTLNCPAGGKGIIGYTTFHQTQVYEAKNVRTKI